jgi:hypothetical protein
MKAAAAQLDVSPILSSFYVTGGTLSKLKASATLAVASSELQRAYSIYAYAHQSASSLVDAFDAAKTARGNKRGVLTDQEQDILRAALVMACAGIDAVLKQAIRDSLSALLEKQPKVREGFEKFIRRRIEGVSDLEEAPLRGQFLATVLADKDPRARLIEQYIRQLTGDSLQSWEELASATAALGLDAMKMGLDRTKLTDVFRIRNKVIHELDMDLTAKVRKRKVRSQSDLLDNADLLLRSTGTVLEHLDKLF